MGLGKPPVSTITVNVGYSTRFFMVPEDSRPDWNAMLILGHPPDRTRLGACFFVETGELQVTLGGQFRDYPPDDEAGFLKFAETLENPELFRMIQNAAPRQRSRLTDFRRTCGTTTGSCRACRKIFSCSATRFAVSIRFMGK